MHIQIYNQVKQEILTFDLNLNHISRKSALMQRLRHRSTVLSLLVCQIFVFATWIVKYLKFLIPKFEVASCMIEQPKEMPMIDFIMMCSIMYRLLLLTALLSKEEKKLCNSGGPLMLFFHKMFTI